MIDFQSASTSPLPVLGNYAVYNIPYSPKYCMRYCCPDLHLLAYAAIVPFMRNSMTFCRHPPMNITKTFSKSWQPLGDATKDVLLARNTSRKGQACGKRIISDIADTSIDPSCQQVSKRGLGARIGLLCSNACRPTSALGASRWKNKALSRFTHK